jgi:hypothetical protein
MKYGYARVCIIGYGSSPSRCGPAVSIRRPNPRSPGSRAKSFHTCQGLRPRRAGRVLAIMPPSMLPSAFLSASAPGTILFSRLNGWPMRSPADASPTPSRMPVHGSGPMWIAAPSSQWTCTTYSLPVSTGAPEKQVSSETKMRQEELRSWQEERRALSHELSPDAHTPSVQNQELTGAAIGAVTGLGVGFLLEAGANMIHPSAGVTSRAIFTIAGPTLIGTGLGWGAGAGYIHGKAHLGWGGQGVAFDFGHPSSFLPATARPPMASRDTVIDATKKGATKQLKTRAKSRPLI